MKNGEITYKRVKGSAVNVKCEIEYKDATIEERKVAKIIKERIGTETEIVNECRTEEGKVIENLLNALLNL